jgi:hypothetical protein
MFRELSNPFDEFGVVFIEIGYAGRILQKEES